VKVLCVKHACDFIVMKAFCGRRKKGSVKEGREKKNFREEGKRERWRTCVCVCVCVCVCLRERERRDEKKYLRFSLNAADNQRTVTRLKKERANKQTNKQTN